MNKLFQVITLIGFILLVSVSNYEAFYRKYRVKNNVGKLGPNFALSSNEDFRSFSSKSGMTLVVFWASWCQPCLDSLRQLKVYYKRNTETSKFVVAINSGDMDKDYYEIIEEFKGIYKIVFIRNKSEELNELFPVSSIPEYFLYDQDSKLKSFGREAIQEFYNL